MTAYESQDDFLGRRALTYLGAYRPSAPLRLIDGYVLIPHCGGMKQLWEGASIRLNTSYFTSVQPRQDVEVAAAFRKWLIFDSFVLGDSWPVLCFDRGIAGAWVAIEPGVSCEEVESEYNVENYSDIGHVVYFPPNAESSDSPKLRYDELYARYIRLGVEIKEQIEWLSSPPEFSGRWRVDGIFKPNYWKLLHLVIFLDNFFGPPPTCEESRSTCNKCGRLPNSHHQLSARGWRRECVRRQVQDLTMAGIYAECIDAAFGIRNRMAHKPTLDRSSYRLSPIGETRIYDVRAAIDSYEIDAVALEALLVALRTICRYLLLDRAFNTGCFRPVPSLKSTTIGVTP